jgi:arylformamidase
VSRIIDVSQPVGSSTAVWPGDQTCRVDWTLRRDRGDSVNVAALTLSAHTGTHVDGPLHVDDAAEAPAALDLLPFIGPAIVVDVTAHGVIDRDAVADLDLTRVSRVLFRTRTSTDIERFPDDFAPLAPDLARWIAQAGVKLVGTDAPSVDPFDSKTLDAHRILGKSGVAILENLVLDNVEPGHYTLVALPLRLVEADSSPVRAVLVEGTIR